ncbi:MAG TPA: ABC transporter permease [Ktedonobacterales bacterium]|nr:ABC transporter permease [Ktedonobacterales bacterium]
MSTPTSLPSDAGGPAASAPALTPAPLTTPGAPAAAPRRGNMLASSFSSALEALWANRLRSLLTTLGVIVGVAAVITVVTLTQGAAALITSGLGGLGTTTLLISPGTASLGGVRQSVGTEQSLTQADADALTTVSHVAAVSPVVGVTAQLVFGNQNWNTRVQGVYANFQTIGNWQLSEGAWFSDQDERGALPVAVLGPTVAQNLFAATSTAPVGQTVLIRGQAFQVVGVLQSKGASGLFNQDDVVFVPFNTAVARLDNSSFVSQIEAQADDASTVNVAVQAVTTTLEQRHHIAAGAQDDFQVRSSAQLVATAQQVTQTLTFLLAGIAAISLVVGGIGIMNIMLVSVTERTREIGIRMAVGARRRDVRNQFLIEALTLSVAGGLIGILLGLTAGLGLTLAFSLPFTISPVALLLAFGVSGAIGVGFGFYPAVRASQLDPIVALRTE